MNKLNKIIAERNILKSTKAHAHDSRAIANAFIAKNKAVDDAPLPRALLMDYVSFAHGHSLALLDAPLIKHNIFAFGAGPRTPELYEACQGVGRGFLVDSLLVMPSGKTYQAQLSAAEADLIDRIYSTYPVEQCFTVGKMLRAEGHPWEQRRRQRKFNDIIPDEELKNYYQGKLRLAPVRPVSPVREKNSFENE